MQVVNNELEMEAKKMILKKETELQSRLVNQTLCT